MEIYPLSGKGDVFSKRNTGIGCHYQGCGAEAAKIGRLLNPSHNRLHYNRLHHNRLTKTSYTTTGFTTQGYQSRRLRDLKPEMHPNFPRAGAENEKNAGSGNLGTSKDFTITSCTTTGFTTTAFTITDYTTACCCAAW